MATKGTPIVTTILAWNTSTNSPQTADTANITVRGVGDGAEFTTAAPAITEVDSTNLKGIYSVNLNGTENNYYSVTLGGKSSTPNVTIIPTRWTNESVALANALASLVPGTYAAGTAGAALGRIGSGQITTTGPVAQSGAVAICQGDSYYAADGRSLDFTDVSAGWPVLTAASVVFVIVRPDGVRLFSVAGSVVTATPPGEKVRVELSALQTAAMVAGSYTFYVEATLSSGHTARLVTGPLEVLP